jgi:hypothetical protein
MQSQNISSAEFVQQLKKDIQAFQDPHYIRSKGRATAPQPWIKFARRSRTISFAPPCRASQCCAIWCNDPEIAQTLGCRRRRTRGMDTGSADTTSYYPIRRVHRLTKKQLADADASATAAHLYYVELIIHTLPWFVVMAIQIGAEGTFDRRPRRWATA